MTILCGPENLAPRAGDYTGVTADSRLVTPGMLFVAVAGARADGRRFIADAVAKGAAAVLATPCFRFLSVQGRMMKPDFSNTRAASGLARCWRNLRAASGCGASFSKVIG